MIKTIHDVNSFMTTADNETILIGDDEMGNEFTIVFNTIELLEWIDIEHMKNQSIKYIKNLNN